MVRVRGGKFWGAEGFMGMLKRVAHRFRSISIHLYLPAR